MQRFGRAAMLAAGLFLMAEVARAGTITNAGSSVVNNGNGSAAFVVVNRGTQHRVGISKSFTSLGPIDVNMHVQNSPAGTLIYNFSEAITNNTTSPMTSFVVQLGSGTGAGFTPGAPNGVMFDASSLATSLFFSTATFDGTAQTLTFSGGFIPPMSAIADLLQFQIIVPNAPGGVAYNFTIRNLPLSAVPEPSALALSGLGSLGLLLYGRVRRGRQALVS